MRFLRANEATLPGMKRSMQTLIIASVAAGLLSALPGCQIATPFRGRGYNALRQTPADERPETVLLAITYAKLKPLNRGPFDRGIDEIMGSINRQPGLIGSSFRRELLGSQVWTMSVWEDETAFTEFVYSDVHDRAMRDGRVSVVTFKQLQREIPTSDLPVSWERAQRMIAEEPVRSGEGG